MRIAMTVFLALLLEGCGTLYSKGNVALVESPEIIHDESEKGAFFFRAEPAMSIQIADDASARPIALTNPPTLENTGVLNAGMNYGLKNHFEVGFGLNPFEIVAGVASGRGMVKYQLIGDSFEKNSVEGSMLSAFSHLNLSYMRVSGNQDGVFGAGGYPWHASTSMYALDGGLSYGYRFNGHWFTYIGGSYQIFQVSADIHQDEGVTHDYPQVDFHLPGTKGNSWSAAGGFEFGVEHRLQLAYSYSRVRWNNLTSDFFFLSVGIGAIQLNVPPPKISPIE